MFTLSLHSLNPGIEESIVREKFLEFFGSYSVNLELDTPDKVLLLEDQLFEILSIMELSIEPCHLLLSDTVTSKTRKIDYIEDLKFFIDDSNQVATLLDPEYPEVGNYHVQHEPVEPLVTATPERLVNPYDIFDDPNVEKNISTPHSYHDNDGIHIVTDTQRADNIAVKARLAALGASFPYLNEKDLMDDFDRLSRMDEVTDGDLIELLKLGFEGIGAVYREGRDLLGKGLNAFKKWWDENDDANNNANNANNADIQAQLDELRSELNRAGVEVERTDEVSPEMAAIKDEAEKAKDSDNTQSSDSPGDSQSSGEPKDETKEEPKDETERIKQIAKEAKSEIKKAKEPGDEHIQAARNKANQIKDDDPNLADKIKDDIKDKTEKLKD